MIEERTVQEAVAELLRYVGEDPGRSGLVDTPRRVAEMYRELFSGVDQDPVKELQVTFNEGQEDMVMLRDIPFYSMCEHHLIPFFGTANVGYLPSGCVVGVSKMVRALEVLAHRPQLQERLTAQLVDALFDSLHPEGAAVVLKAEHLCMSMRGVQKPGTKVVTSAVRGSFSRESLNRREVLSLLGGGTE